MGCISSGLVPDAGLRQAVLRLQTLDRVLGVFVEVTSNKFPRINTGTKRKQILLKLLYRIILHAVRQILAAAGRAGRTRIYQVYLLYSRFRSDGKLQRSGDMG